ncbi:hypothetical protein NQD34_000862 [Periophthalmus magnuspinnatus]|nr:hypothetical protein NQD34_000862 [Periophthalmus magnuspinnatus]
MFWSLHRTLWKGFWSDAFCQNTTPQQLYMREYSVLFSLGQMHFRSTPSLSGVVHVYDDLRRRGLEFPMTDLDALSPIHTPTRSIPENGTHDSTPPTARPTETQPQPQQTGLSASHPVQHNDGPIPLSAEQEQKLRSELALVKGNLTVMSEMLNEMIPGQSKADDTELLQQLYSVCKKMQSRVVELIPQIMDEGFVEELLVVNDDLNNVFIRYERFDRLNKAQSSNNQQSCVSSSSLIEFSAEPSNPSEPAVITTTSHPPVASSAAQRQTPNHKVEEEEFDMFAQTRGSSLAEQRKSVKYEDPGAVEGLAGALDTRLLVTGGMSVANTSTQNNTDHWLSCDVPEDQPAVSEGVSSEEFDKFLEDRARAGDHNGRSSRSSQPLSRPQRQSTEQQDRTHDQLFSL